MLSLKKYIMVTQLYLFKKKTNSYRHFFFIIIFQIIMYEYKLSLKK